MRSALSALAVVFAASGPAHGGPPSPATSQVDPCVVTCPAGDSVFVAILRHASGSPAHGGEESVLDLCGCPAVRLAPVADGGPYWIEGCTARTLTDVEGIARFPLAAGGVCSAAAIRFFGGGVLIATRDAVASFDQDGDLIVGDGDLAMVDGKVGTGDPTADFDCDGSVTAADRAIAAAHRGHFHASIVGVGGVAEVEFGARAVPNPSRGGVEFILRSPVRGHALLTVHDLTGRRLATVLDREIEPGVHRLPWSGRDSAGRPVAAGLYFHRLTLGARRSHGLLVFIR